MEIIERMFKIMEEKDKKAVDLCNLLDIRTSTMSTWKTRVSDPPAKYLKRISEFLDVSLNYLITGEEVPLNRISKMTFDEEDLLDLYRSLPENKKYEFKGELKGYLKALSESRKYFTPDEKHLSPPHSL